MRRAMTECGCLPRLGAVPGSVCVGLLQISTRRTGDRRSTADFHAFYVAHRCTTAAVVNAALLDPITKVHACLSRQSDRNHSHAQLVLLLENADVHMVTGECGRDELAFGQRFGQRHAA